MSTEHFTWDAMSEVLSDVYSALWAGVLDNYGYPEPVGGTFNRSGIPALRVKDAEGNVFIITAHPEES